MQTEILRDVSSGIVPATVQNFSELHDYVDANCYGGTEALLEAMDAAGPDTDEAHQANLDKLSDVMNEAMEIVNAWLQNGGTNARTCPPNSGWKR